MAICRITFASGDTADVTGSLQAVMDELHKVATRREHTFAVFDEPGGVPVAMRPDSVVHIRPLTTDEP
ncbi:MAG: hypothetical protein M3P40_06905 [Actinomycetota bacterium]|nr:hypothetical protein [Actinomycetota bacterium]